MRIFIFLLSMTLLFTPLVSAKEKGNIQIYCQPKVKVYLDGKYKGTSKRRRGNYLIKRVPYGDHTILLKNKSDQEELSIIVNSELASISSVSFPPIDNNKKGKKKISSRDKEREKMLKWDIDYIIPHIDSQFNYDKKPKLVDQSKHIIPIPERDIDSALQNVEIIALINPYGEIIVANIMQSSGCKKYDTTVLNKSAFTKFNPAKKDKKYVSAWISWGVPLRYLQYSDEYKYLYESSGEKHKAPKPQTAYEIVTDTSKLTKNKIPISDNNSPVDKYPEITYFKPLMYPFESIQKRQKGEVWLKAFVNKEGEVTDLKISKRSKHLSLDFAAMQAGFNNTFTPATYNSEPVECWLDYIVYFSLKKNDSTDNDLMQPLPDSVTEDVMPEMIKEKTPKYPHFSLENGEQGTVWVKALVGKKGDVLKAFVGRSSGLIRLDKAAVDAAFENKFRPATRNGRSLKVWVTYKVDFSLVQ